MDIHDHRGGVGGSVDRSRGSPGRARAIATRWPSRTVLGSLPTPARDALLSLGIQREFAAGTTLIMEGDTTTEVILLIDGWVKVMGVTEDGGRALLDLRSGGDVVGE